MTRKAERIKRELLDIKQASPDHLLHAKHVVAWAASHKSSALYTEFEWDDTAAAEQYRLDQARRIITTTILVEGGGPVFVSLSIDRAAGGGYREVGDVVRDTDLSSIMLLDALRELGQMQQRYERVKELVSVWNEADKLRRAHRKKKRAAEQPTNP